MSNWYYQENGMQRGPISEPELATLFTEKRLSAYQPIRKGEAGDWTYPGEVPEFCNILSRKQKFISAWESTLARKSPGANDDLKWEDVKSIMVKAAVSLVLMGVLYGIMYLFTGWVPSKVSIPIK